MRIGRGKHCRWFFYPEVSLFSTFGIFGAVDIYFCFDVVALIIDRCAERLYGLHFSDSCTEQLKGGGRGQRRRCRGNW